jgi:hypothetical protein
MRKHLALMVAAGLFSGSTVMAQAADEKVERAADRAADRAERAADRAGDAVDRAGEKVADGKDAETQPLALPAGVTATDLNEAGDIRNAFEAVTEGALSDDAFDNITNRLVDADRDRIAKYTDGDPDMKPLNDKIAALNKAWEDKYGKEFDLDEAVVFGEKGFVAIAQGEINNPQQLVGNWPVKPQASGAAMASGKQAAAADTAEQRKDLDQAAGGDANLDKGRNVAVARYPAGHGLPAIDASLIHELPDIWRFDLPDNIDGQKLSSNLLTHLGHLGDPSQWPADVNEAYRAVGHHVLAALYDVQGDKQGKQANQ